MVLCSGLLQSLIVSRVETKLVSTNNLRIMRLHQFIAAVFGLFILATAYPVPKNSGQWSHACSKLESMTPFQRARCCQIISHLLVCLRCRGGSRPSAFERRMRWVKQACSFTRVTHWTPRTRSWWCSCARSCFCKAQVSLQRGFHYDPCLSLVE